MERRAQLGELVELPWKLPRLIESAQEANEARQQCPTPTLEPDTARMFSKESASIPKVFI